MANDISNQFSHEATYRGFKRSPRGYNNVKRASDTQRRRRRSNSTISADDGNFTDTNLSANIPNRLPHEGTTSSKHLRHKCTASSKHFRHGDTAASSNDLRDEGFTTFKMRQVVKA